MTGHIVQRLVSMARQFVRRTRLGRRHYMFMRMPSQNLPLAFTHRRYLFLVCFTVVFFLCLATTVRRVHELEFHHHHPHHELKSTFAPSPPHVGISPRHSLSQDPDTMTLNNTLGFQEIFVLNLPSRTDKRDALTLSAALSNITVSFRNGNDGKAMVAKAVPPTFFNHYYSAELTTIGMLGSWRGHVDILREIVEKNLGSALILEDDVDWDVNIKSQLLQFARGSRSLLKSLDHRGVNEDRGLENTFMQENDASLFGDPSTWDILWLGHCGGWAPSVSKRPYAQIIHNDPTVPPSFEIEDLTQGLGNDTTIPCSAHAGRDPKDRICDSPRLKENERIIQLAGSPTCSFGYAVTQMGARKLLYHIGGSSLTNVDGNFDTELTEACRGDKDLAPLGTSSTLSDNESQEEKIEQVMKEVVGGQGQIRCLTVSPPYFVHHRAKGSLARDSDMKVSSKKKEEVVRDMEETRGVKWSVRLNAGRLVRGEQAVSQYE